MASDTAPTVQGESASASGSLAHMFHGATAANTTDQRTTDAQTLLRDTPLNSDQSLAAANQPTDDVGRDTSQAPASSSPGPSARHGSAEHNSPTRGSPGRAKRSVTRPEAEGPPTPMPPARSSRTLSPQGIHGQSGSLEALTIWMNVLESRLSEDVAQTRLQLDHKLQAFMEDIQRKTVQAEATYAQFMAPICEKCKDADDKHAELGSKIIEASERLTGLEVEIKAMKVRVREPMPSPEPSPPWHFDTRTPPEDGSMPLPQAFPGVGCPVAPHTSAAWTGGQAGAPTYPSAGPPTSCGG